MSWTTRKDILFLLLMLMCGPGTAAAPAQGESLWNTEQMKIDESGSRLLSGLGAHTLTSMSAEQLHFYF